MSAKLKSCVQFAEKEHGVSQLNLWDIAYYSEKQKQKLFSISDEDLRPYFPEQKVVSGLFEVLNRVFGMKVKERNDVDVWHESVRFLRYLLQKKGTLRGSFYLDLYARETQAWRCLDG